MDNIEKVIARQDMLLKAYNDDETANLVAAE